MPTEERTVDFVKLVAAGNDFILIDGDRQAPPWDLPAFSSWACHREDGVGADGLLVLRRKGPGHVRLTVVNPDGSIAKMCGNGARCAAFYTMRSDSAGPLTVEFAGRDRWHTLSARPAEDLVELTSPQPRGIEGPIPIDGFDFYTLDTGTEYAVAFVNDVDRIDVPGLGRAVRHHPRFAPGGTSVSFAERRDDGLKVRTYERGNEAETRSCGSGAVACAVLAHHLGLVTGPRVPVHNRSGMPLVVGIEGGGPPFDALTLAGPARLVFTGSLVWRERT